MAKRAQERCHSSAPFFVIPVWDPEKLIMYYTTFSIKSWIPDWNDITGATFMTSFFFLDPSSLGTGMTP
ncbi:MAG: hypothetical protein LBE46_04490 [Wolbachia pipientis]|jgi:hypothetical protein|nr:hypothetical protein [Wolbachia pipientis]